MVHLAVGDGRDEEPEMHPEWCTWQVSPLFGMIEMISQRCTRMVHLADIASVGDDGYVKPEMHPNCSTHQFAPQMPQEMIRRLQEIRKRLSRGRWRFPMGFQEAAKKAS